MACFFLAVQPLLSTVEKKNMRDTAFIPILAKRLEPCSPATTGESKGAEPLLIRPQPSRPELPLSESGYIHPTGDEEISQLTEEEEDFYSEASNRHPDDRDSIDSRYLVPNFDDDQYAFSASSIPESLYLVS